LFLCVEIKVDLDVQSWNSAGLLVEAVSIAGRLRICGTVGFRFGNRPPSPE